MLWFKLVLNITKHCRSLPHTPCTKSPVTKVMLEDNYLYTIPSPNRTTLKLCPAILPCCYMHLSSILFLLDPLLSDLYVSTGILLTVSDLSDSCFDWCLLLVSVSLLATPAEWPAALSLWLGGQTNVTLRESITIIINVCGFCFAPNWVYREVSTGMQPVPAVNQLSIYLWFLFTSSPHQILTGTPGTTVTDFWIIWADKNQPNGKSSQL